MPPTRKSGTVPRGAVRTAGFSGIEDWEFEVECGMSKSTAGSPRGEFPKSGTVPPGEVRTTASCLSLRRREEGPEFNTWREGHEAKCAATNVDKCVR